MKTIFSILASAALLMSILTACGTTSKTNADNGRLEPTAPVAATTRPETMGEKASDAARDAGSAVGNAVEDAGDMVGDAAKDAGNAVSDMFDGNSGAKTGAGLEESRATPKP